MAFLKKGNTRPTLIETWKSSMCDRLLTCHNVLQTFHACNNNSVQFWVQKQQLYLFTGNVLSILQWKWVETRSSIVEDTLIGRNKHVYSLQAEICASQPPRQRLHEIWTWASSHSNAKNRIYWSPSEGWWTQARYICIAKRISKQNPGFCLQNHIKHIYYGLQKGGGARAAAQNWAQSLHCDANRYLEDKLPKLDVHTGAREGKGRKERIKIIRLPPKFQTRRMDWELYMSINLS